jgi:hypothetical protein
MTPQRTPYCLLHQCRGSALESRLRAGIGDLPLVALRGYRADENDRALHAFLRHPALRAARITVLGDARDHLQRPVDGRHQVDLKHLAEEIRRVDAYLAARLVDAHRQVVAGDAGGRNADTDQTVLPADGVEDAGAKVRVGGIAPEREGDVGPRFGVDLRGYRLDLVRQIDHGDGPHLPFGQFGGNCSPDAAGGAGDDGDLVVDFHVCVPFVLGCTTTCMSVVT